MTFFEKHHFTWFCIVISENSTIFFFRCIFPLLSLPARLAQAKCQRCVEYIHICSPSAFKEYYRNNFFILLRLCSINCRRKSLGHNMIEGRHIMILRMPFFLKRWRLVLFQLFPVCYHFSFHPSNTSNKHIKNFVIVDLFWGVPFFFFRTPFGYVYYYADFE